MTPYERVRRAIHFRGPDKVPLWMADANADMTNDLYGTQSTTFVPMTQEELHRLIPDFDGTLVHTEWGNITGKLNSTLSTTETVRSGFQEWEEFYKNYRYPDIDAPYRYELATSRIASRSAEGKYELAWFGSGYFGVLYGLRKMEDLLMDLGLYQKELGDFCDRLEPLFMNCLERWAAAGANGVLFGEDLGLQDRLMMSPDTWRQIFKPRYARFIAKAHSLKLDVLMHSCGYIREIIPDLVEIGLDVLQFDQIGIYDLDDLARNFGGKIAFFCPVDIQSVMPKGNKDQIRSAARRMVEKLGQFNGGFLAKDYPTWKDVGVKPVWAAWMRDAFLEQQNST
jgi:uroporphyrinogen decarboxylase